MIFIYLFIYLHWLLGNFDFGGIEFWLKNCCLLLYYYFFFSRWKKIDTFRGLRNLDFDLAPNSHTPASLLERAISPTSLSLQQPSSNSLPPSTTTNMSQITANSNSATNALLLLGSLVDNSPSDLLLGGGKIFDSYFDVFFS